MQITSAILHDTFSLMIAVTVGEKPTTFGTKLEQWSVTLLPIGKIRVVDNMVSMF